jgi:fructose-1,6-bisphosphatase II
MSQAPSSPGLLAYALRNVTEVAALAAHQWMGRGDGPLGDHAATRAMRDELNRLAIKGRIIIGEGEKDGAPGLFGGEQVGCNASGRAFDIAVDPVEGTSYLAKGLTNAMAVIAMAPEGTMFDPGPAFYMDKFVAPAAANGKIDAEAPATEKLKQLAKALGKSIQDLTVFVLEKPRHIRLIEDIRSLGARVAQYPAGDVAGAVMAAVPGSGVDALMGTGGTPEGIISACAVRGMGGVFYGRLAPQLPSERIAVTKAGMDTEKWLGIEDLVRSDKVYFCATGISTGLLFDGVEIRDNQIKTQSLLISGENGERQVLTTYHRLDDVADKLTTENVNA